LNLDHAVIGISATRQDRDEGERQRDPRRSARRIEQGLARLLMLDGAQVELENPAPLELRSFD
jgi:hypothetical protein